MNDTGDGRDRKAGYQTSWKKNVRKVPPSILDKVADFQQPECVVACLRRIPKDHLSHGIYSHLGMIWADGGVTFPEQVVPDPRTGRYSRANIEGKSIPRKDLPMVTRTFSVDAPNYGDWSLGSHEVSWDRDVYQRDYIPPRELAIKIEQVAEDVQLQSLVFRFTVDEVLDRGSTDFHERLLFNINLLQENVGNFDVFPSSAPVETYLKSLYVNWELLPPGEREVNIAKIFRSVKTDEPRIRQQIAQRYDFLARLKPLQFIRGTNGFRNYCGAQFAPDLVVFENIEYGNAIYVMFEDWATLSQKSRTELLAEHPDNIVRVPHTADWEGRLSGLIRKELSKRKRR